jgi:hypothetical protein
MTLTKIDPTVLKDCIASIFRAVPEGEGTTTLRNARNHLPNDVITQKS